MLIETRFYLIKAEPCPKCAGTGKVTSPWWQKWQQAQARGMDVNSFFQLNRGAGWPIEQFRPCRECGGSGEHRTETTLTEALAELGVMVHEL